MGEGSMLTAGLLILLAAEPLAAKVTIHQVPDSSLYRLSTLNWNTCLEDRAHRAALEAVGVRKAMPGNEAIFVACAEQEAEVRRSLMEDRAISDVDQWMRTLREEATIRVSRAIASTYRQRNHD